MGQIRRSHSSAFKAKAAFEAIKKEKTITQLSSEYGGAPKLDQSMEEMHDAGASGNISKTRSKQKQDTEELVSALYHQIGQLKVEVDWLKKTEQHNS